MSGWRENTHARREKRKPRALTEWDFLLGVHDETRLGALRFRALPDGVFIDSDAEFAAPPLTSLRELQAASLQFEQHINDEENPEYEKRLTHYLLRQLRLAEPARKLRCATRMETCA
jgi:serine/threonine-protein kinase HipA